MAPPLFDEFWVKVEFITFNVPEVPLLTPPPRPLFPFEIPRLFRVTLAPKLIAKTLTVLLPLMMICEASAEPSMVTSAESVREEARVIVAPESPAVKSIVSPGPAFEIASRREPGPLSLVLFTVIVVAAYTGVTPTALKISAREVMMNISVFLELSFILNLLLIKIFPRSIKVKTIRIYLPVPCTSFELFKTTFLPTTQ